MQQLSLTLDVEPRMLARRTDPATSHAAAARVAEFAESHHDTILKVLRQRGPLTSHEIATFCTLDAHRILKRCGELQTARLADVVKDGEGKPLTRLSPNGRAARVWFAL